MLRDVWATPAPQGRLSDRVSHAVRRCPATKPAALSLPLSGGRGSGYRVAAHGADRRPCRAGAALHRDALGFPGPLRGGDRAVGRRAADRIRGKCHHPARACAPRRGARRGRTRRGAPLVHRRLSRGMAETRDPGRSHRGRPRWRIRAQLGRPYEQFRTHRRPLAAGGPSPPLSRLGPRLRSQTQTPAVRAAEGTGPAGKPGRDIPDRRRRGDPLSANGWRRRRSIFSTGSILPCG